MPFFIKVEKAKWRTRGFASGIFLQLPLLHVREMRLLSRGGDNMRGYFCSFAETGKVLEPHKSSPKCLPYLTI